MVWGLQPDWMFWIELKLLMRFESSPSICCQISDIRLVTSLCVWVQGLKMLKEFVYPWMQPSFSAISEDSVENAHASFMSGLFASSMLKHKHCWFKHNGGKYCITMCIFQQNGPNCTLHNCFCQSERIYRLLGARCAVTVKYLCAHWKKCALAFKLGCCLLRQVSVDLLQCLVFKRLGECDVVCPAFCQEASWIQPFHWRWIRQEERRSL